VSTGELVYKCFVVDDNLTDRLMTVSFVRKYPFLIIDGVFESAYKALEAAAVSMPDVLFLDIDMPGINGLDLRTRLEKVTACIFITAYTDYALPAIEVNALDFLVKPVTADRFDAAMHRLRYYLDIHHKSELFDHSFRDDSFFIKDGYNNIKIQSSDIIYLEALKDYTAIITREKKYCVLTLLGRLLEEPFFRHFIRIHRSYAVPEHNIQKFNSREVVVEGKILPVGRSYKESLEKLLK
jgi:DNA-binding LytR/AlgR family response regulator